MVRNYKPKSICGKVDGSLMKRAVEEVMKGRSVRQTSKHLAIDRITLSRVVNPNHLPCSVVNLKPFTRRVVNVWNSIQSSALQSGQPKPSASQRDQRVELYITFALAEWSIHLLS
ncbi:hypothetical protein AVEN_121492-1 [Araneus ventricosus]|uniref:HTH psq-type domain-containing protein n=1 Tax=Araneus ventricosus TaxID=182803 RepID=A0A4Y2K8K7_ARAVE|nr:hypothetical protein AVEN_121492-1 [Araneus ventricosus]